jgi:hypothetical protein
MEIWAVYGYFANFCEPHPIDFFITTMMYDVDFGQFSSIDSSTASD